MPRLIPLLVSAAAIAACQPGNAEQSSPPSERRTEAAKTWLRQLKADDQDTARLLVRECWSEGGSLLSDAGKLQIAR